MSVNHEESLTLNDLIERLERQRAQHGGDVRVLIWDTVSAAPNDSYFSNLTNVEYDVFEPSGPTFVVINSRRDIDPGVNA